MQEETAVYGAIGETMPDAGAIGAVPDMALREAGLRERMDGPLTFADWMAASRDIARVNRWTRAYAPTLAFLERVVTQRGVGYEPLHIVDVGCGHGDVLRRVAKWAAQRSVPVRLTGVDLHEYAERGARLCAREERMPGGQIEWCTADVFALKLEQPADVVISSLFTHHLSHVEVVRFLQWSEANARCGWIVNDLRRSARAYKLYDRAARWARLHPLVVEDGLVSLRRAFVAGEWHALLAAAEVPDAIVVERGTRLCVERVKRG